MKGVVSGGSRAKSFTFTRNPLSTIPSTRLSWRRREFSADIIYAYNYVVNDLLSRIRKVQPGDL